MHLHHVDNDRLANDFFQRDYHDRGMLKWGGFYLSDHTSALAKMHAAERVEALRPQQAQDEVSRRLASAWRHKRPVHLQLNVWDANQVAATIDGQVAGVDEDQIVIRLASGRYRFLQLADIRCVSTGDGV
ncbi:hypothetical protein [Levilactobacillus lindianensis]|uniref:hypothetical protein n=1 Tax=Levilactobacillus lindianensis TaxID=2486018 RepID=UPI000F7397B8|nr:hypothetical protein [Levilactobacillus lindianensis]